MKNKNLKLHKCTCASQPTTEQHQQVPVKKLGGGVSGIGAKSEISTEKLRCVIHQNSITIFYK